jgi:hypothetical protein
MDKVTVVLTACNRPDLLEPTLDSFFKHNTYPIQEFIIIDDGIVTGCNDFVNTKYSTYLNTELYPFAQFTLMYNQVKIRQIRSIDLAYSKVKTDYIFHMEEDWEFLRPNFIEKSMDIMKEDANIITVWLRSPLDKTLHHTYSKETYRTESGIEYKKCDIQYPRGLWNGFTLNPSLKRMVDYDRVKPYQDLPRLTPDAQSGGNPLECDISVAYAQLGYYAVTLLDQYINHIGWERHII